MVYTNERFKDGWKMNDEWTESRLWAHKEATIKDDERKQHVATTTEY